MSDFTFSATAECNVCGEYLSSSDEDCDHNGRGVWTHVFRRFHDGRDSMVGVETTAQHKWQKLSEKVGDDWIAYQYLGTREEVTSMLESHLWDGVGDLPMRSMAVNAPEGTGSED